MNHHPFSAPPGLIGDVFVRHLGLIGDLSDDDRAALRSLSGSIRTAARGDDLLRIGERPTEAVVVLDGLLQRYTMSADGKRQIHSVYLADDTPSLETLHIDVMDNTLGALAPSRVAFVPHAELHRVMAASPTIQGLMWRETLVQAAVFRAWLMRNSQLLAHAQLAHFFCEIACRAEAAGHVERGSCALPMTQEDLADALGMTPVHVNRTLMLLRASGFVEFQGGRLRVSDRARLAEIAGFDPAYLHHRPVDRL